MGEREQDRWRDQRSDVAAEQVAAQARRTAQETEVARGLVADFVRRARERNLATTELSARAYDGRSTYRTHQRGWYLRRNHSIAVGEEGGFYVLSVPSSLKARLTGVTVAPSDPPIVVGKGGRDGESIDLAELLELRLADGDGFP